MCINLKSKKNNLKSFNMYNLSFVICLKFLIIIKILSVSSHQLNKNSKYEVKLNCENNWMNIEINLRSKLNESLITKENTIKDNFKIIKEEDKNLKKKLDVINQNLTIKSFINNLNLSNVEHDNQKVKTIQNHDNLKQEFIPINKTIKDENLISKFVSNKNFTTKNIKIFLKNIDQNVKSSKFNNKINKMYLEGWENIPKCSPKIKFLNNSVIDHKSLYEFSLSLKPVEEREIDCGLIRMRNKITDDLEFQHTIIIEYNDDIYDNKNKVLKSIKKKDALLVYCKMPEAKFYQAYQKLWWSNNFEKQSVNQRFLEKKQIQQFIEHFKEEKKNELINRENKKNFTMNNLDTKISEKNKLNITNKLKERIKRDASSLDQNNFPTNFTETVEELIDYSGNFTGSGPVPKLYIAVRQNGELVNSSLDVHPGTPLEMVIYLDEKSADVYGLLVSFLKVTDNNSNKVKQQEEIIILDGCSIDQYIFGNFESIDNGKSILAKFRAFKFPESNYVLFVGTVNVCIGQCTPVVCAGSDQQFAYGRRRRRDLNNQTKNFLFNVTLAPSVNNKNNNLNITQKIDLSKSNQFVTNKVFEVEMSTIIKVTKPKEKSSLIKSEFKKNSNLTLSKKNSFIKRPIITRKFKKRFDSNEFLSKKNHISSTKMYLTSNYSNKMNYGFLYFFFTFIFHIFFINFVHEKP